MKQSVIVKIAVLAVLGCAMVVAGCGSGGKGDGGDNNGGGGNNTADTTAPVISAESVSPAQLDFKGGNVTIQANVTDDVAVGSVSAQISTAGKEPVSVTLTAGTGSTYSATYKVPGNGNNNGTDIVYSVLVSAKDTSNNAKDGTAQTVTVKAAPLPGAGNPIQ